MTLILPGAHGYQKPPLGALLDPGHPLSRGALGLWLFNEGNGPAWDLTGTLPLGLVSGAAYTGTREGWGVKAAAAQAGASAALPAAWKISPPLTIWVRAIILGTFPTGARLWGLQPNNTGATPFSSAMIDTIGTNSITLNGNSSGTYSQRTNASVTAYLTLPTLFTGVFDTAASSLYANGTLLNTGAAYSSIQYGATADIGGGNYGTLNRNVNTIYLAGGFYNRALSAAEIAWLAEEPYAMIQAPAYRRYYSFSSAPHFRRAGSLRSGSRHIPQRVIGV